MQNRKYPLWSWQEDGVRLAEYRCSLNNLKRFLAVVNVNQLQTLEDLSAIASLVGHDLRVIAMAKDQEFVEKIEYSTLGVSDLLRSAQKLYSFRTVLNGQELGVTAKDDYVNISKFCRVGFQGHQREELRIKLPTDRDIAIGNNPNIDEVSLFATDLRGSGKKHYLPALEPNDAETQQGFMHLLQECIEDLVSILAP